MTEESENKQEATSRANVTGWNKLPNELQHNIIAHAVNTDAWEAIKTFTKLSLTSRHLNDLTGVQALRQYRDNLDGGRRVSDAVIEEAFKNNNFSGDAVEMYEPHIVDKSVAVVPALQFRPPEERSVIFSNIAETKDTKKRMSGYTHIAEHAGLFRDDELRKMDGHALDSFRKHIRFSPPSEEECFAAEVLAKRYEDIGDDVRARLQETLSSSKDRRTVFADAIVSHNPSLLKHNSFRSLVRESVADLRYPHEALAQLAPYIDKNSGADTDFVAAVFDHIAAQDATDKLRGYTCIAEHADLFREDELRKMDGHALDFFREDLLDSHSRERNFLAAELLAKRYEDIGDKARDALQETLSSSRDRRTVFADAIVSHNPSLLKHDSIRSLVRESFADLPAPREALAQLASYIDRNSRVDADFVVEQSFRQFGGGAEHELKAPALDIAKFFDREIGPEHRDQIAELRQVDTPKGRALASAFEELKREKLERDRPADVSTKPDMAGSEELLKRVEESQRNSDQHAVLWVLGRVAETNQEQMRNSRQALMATVRERGPLVR